MVLTRNGNLLVDGGQNIVLRGVCDFDVVYRMLQNTLINGMMENELFWGANCTTSYSCTQQYMSWPGTWQQFWWNYFWLVKNVLGLNVIRCGAYNTYATGVIYDTLLNYTDNFWTIIGSMFDMAYANGVYVIFCLAGCADYGTTDAGLEWTLPTFSASTGHYDLGQNISDPMSGTIWQTGGQAYNYYVSKAGQIMQYFSNHPGLGAWDVCEEPDFFMVCQDWWDNNGGRPAFAAWMDSITTDLKSQDATHLMTHGAKLDDYYTGACFDPTDDEWYTGECFMDGNDHPNVDLTSFLRYDNRTDPTPCTDGGCMQWFFNQLKTWADSLNKPLLINEYAQDNYDLYNPGIRSVVDSLGIAAACARRPSGSPTLPNWPVSPNTVIPAMPTCACSTGQTQTYTCTDGTVITVDTCDGCNWVATGTVCPTPPPPTCTNGQYQNATLCLDGVTYVGGQVCQDCEWIANPITTCPVPPATNMNQYAPMAFLALVGAGIFLIVGKGKL